MNQFENLMTTLSEECAEITQLVSKIQRFGLNNHRPDNHPHLTAKVLIHRELDDLMAILEMLNDEHGFGYKPNTDAIEAKKVKVKRFMEESKKLGLLQ